MSPSNLCWLALPDRHRYLGMMARQNSQQTEHSLRDGQGLWFQQSLLGRRLRAQIMADMRIILDQWFGYNLVVIGPDIGVPVAEMTRVRRVIHVVSEGEVAPEKRCVIAADVELPFDSESVDVVVVLNGLDTADRPHQVLREIHRVLTPHGHLFVVGHNSVSLRGLWWQVAGWFRGSRPVAQGAPGPRRLEDWLTLLEFSVAPPRHKLVLPLGGSGRIGRWLARVDNWLVDHNIPLGSSYAVFANKTVRGHVSPRSLETARARLMGIAVPKPVVGARGSASRTPLRPVK